MPAPDPLDELSGAIITVGKNDEWQIEATFRELEEYCRRDFDGKAGLDSFRTNERFAIQRYNDKNWVPIEPYAGLKKHKHRRFL